MQFSKKCRVNRNISKNDIFLLTKLENECKMNNVEYKSRSTRFSPANFDCSGLCR